MKSRLSSLIIGEGGVCVFKRICIYILGIFILGLGLVLNSKTGLGVSPIISVPFACSQMSSLSFGRCTSIAYIVLVIIQLLVYRKITLSVLLQIPFSYLFGLLIDFYNALLPISHPSFIIAFFILLLAIFCTALGAFLMVNMELIVNPGDGYVNAFAKVTGKPFGNVKLITDCIMITITLVLSLSLAGHIYGLGLGTILAAMLTGTTISVLDHFLGRQLAVIILQSKKG